MTGENKSKNQISRMRQKRNLTQKALAYALGHSTPDQVSRYERGHLPILETAMKLEILLRAPIRILFDELYAQAKGELKERLGAAPHLKAALGDLYEPDYCAFDELLSGEEVSADVHNKVRRHVTSLINKMNTPSLEDSEESSHE